MRDPFSVRDKFCTLCPLHSSVKNVCVPGEGKTLSRDAAPLPVMILGEAPGREEDEAVRPFVGVSGKLLRSALSGERIPYEQFYITNTVKCFPHGTPKKEHILPCTGHYLKREIELLEPNYILAVGTTALSALSPQKFSDVRGKLIESWIGDAVVFPVWHPAYILRNRSKEDIWRNDLGKFWALVSTDLKLEY